MSEKSFIQISHIKQFASFALASVAIAATSPAAQALQFNFSYAPGTTLEQAIALEVAGGVCLILGLQVTTKIMSVTLTPATIFLRLSRIHHSLCKTRSISAQYPLEIDIGRSCTAVAFNSGSREIGQASG